MLYTVWCMAEGAGVVGSLPSQSPRKAGDFAVAVSALEAAADPNFFEGEAGTNRVLGLGAWTSDIKFSHNTPGWSGAHSCCCAVQDARAAPILAAAQGLGLQSVRKRASKEGVSSCELLACGHSQRFLS